MRVSVSESAAFLDQLLCVNVQKLTAVLHAAAAADDLKNASTCVTALYDDVTFHICLAGGDVEDLPPHVLHVSGRYARVSLGGDRAGT